MGVCRVATSSKRARAAGAVKREDSYARILAVVKKIPRGRVATYGQVAAQAGFARQPRLAGYALHHTLANAAVPWHRVINAAGRISLPPNSEGYREQKRRLEAEGVTFINGRVDLARRRWRTAADAPVLD